MSPGWVKHNPPNDYRQVKRKKNHKTTHVQCCCEIVMPKLGPREETKNVSWVREACGYETPHRASAFFIFNNVLLVFLKVFSSNIILYDNGWFGRGVDVGDTKIKDI